MTPEAHQVLNGLRKTICLSCGSSLEHAHHSGNYLVCTECEMAYPLVDGQFPVLISQPLQELANAYLLYDKHTREEQGVIARLEARAQTSPDKIAVGLRQIAEARGHNLAHFHRLQHALRPFLSTDTLVEAHYRNHASSYGLVLAYYLEKDWSGTAESEAELATIREAVQEACAQYAPDLQSTLVLGAGAGRIAWELGYQFEQVYAVDNSLIMPYHFYRLQQADIRFFEINANNVLHHRHRVREITASLRASSYSPATFKDNAARITYFLGDATRLPLADQSQSAVVSVYFTDVLPLRNYLAELRRVLKPGGVFIHFGPLVYHFEDESQMRSPEEVTELFEEEGFRVRTSWFKDEQAATNRGTMISTYYTNWFFAATYSPEASKPRVLLNSVLGLATPLPYELHGLLNGQEETYQNVLITSSAGDKIKISTLLLDFLRGLDGTQSFAEVWATLAEDYDLPAHYQEQLVTTLQHLVDKKVVRLMN